MTALAEAGERRRARPVAAATGRRLAAEFTGTCLLVGELGAGDPGP